ncbi:MAG TPA: NnrU family protein [Xanthobacteraceae bacterium]|nr:NnrU family protein [Xanthobacteraceae bacterium]
MGLILEILGLVVFLGAHVFVTMRDHRAALIKTLGAGPYRGLFSLVSLIGIVLAGYGFAHYRAESLIMLWNPPPWTRHIVVALMWPASIMVVAAYIRGHIARVLKHPMLVGVKTWAAAHLCANGDLGGIILFGSVLLWAGYDRATLKRRADPGAPPIPVGGATNDIIAVVVGTILYLALGFLFHPYVVGLPAFGTSAFGH